MVDIDSTNADFGCFSVLAKLSTVWMGLKQQKLPTEIAMGKICNLHERNARQPTH